VVTADHVVHIAVTSGRACTPWVGLPAGRHRIGRAAGCAVEIAEAEPHHGVLDVAPDGSTTFTQLTGRIDVRVDGEPARPLHPVGDGSELAIGPSVVTVRSGGDVRVERPSGTIAAAPADPWRRVVHRAPALGTDAAPDPLVPPGTQPSHPMPAATGLIGAAVGIGGALAIATLLAQPMFALFALIGGLASFSTWIGGVFVARRHRRRARTRSDAEYARFVADVGAAGEATEERHRRRYPSVSATLGVHGRPFEVGAVSPVWSARVRHGGPLEAVIGEGETNQPVAIAGAGRSELPVGLQLVVDRASRLRSVPVPITFEPGTSTAIHAGRDQLMGLARSIVVQLGTWSGPADWRLVVVTGDPERWRWSEWLPHMRDDLGERIGVLGPEHLDIAPDSVRGGGIDGREADGPGAGEAGVAEPEVLVVVDSVPRLGSRVGGLRRLLAVRGAAALVLVDGTDTVPSICDRVLSVGATGSAHWTASAGPAEATAIAVAGVDEATADRVARALSPLDDPELSTDRGGDLPSDLRIADLTPDAGEPAAIVRRWHAGGSDPRPATAIGRGRHGTIEIDLVRDGPHGLLAGTTGAGKSELLRTLVVGLAARLSPDHLTFVLVDYKGGSTFDACVELPHTVGVVTDLDGGLAERRGRADRRCRGSSSWSTSSRRWRASCRASSDR
jgi:S-DNA-T family DNA segregation ATPase FtsK/SpoIIIE